MIIERVKQTKRDERKTDCLNLDLEVHILSSIRRNFQNYQEKGSFDGKIK